MAVITISRKIASYGDETAQELSKLLQYTFIDRKMLEEELMKKGVSESQLKKYDERRPGFWASLLKDVPGVYTVRLTAPDDVRISRLMKEFDWTEKQAKALIAESDGNRDGFHKCFFNAENENSAEYNLVVNTGSVKPKTAAEIIKYGTEKTITEEDAVLGIKRAKELLFGQKIVNHISFDLKLQIYFLETEVSADKIVLHGIADNTGLIQRAVSAAEKLSGGKEVVSVINVINKYKSFP